MAERSLWEMFTSLLQRAREKRVLKKKQERWVGNDVMMRHLLRIPASPDYQALIDQIMTHDPFETPLLERGRLVHAKEDKYVPADYHGIDQATFDAQYFNTPEVTAPDHPGGADRNPPADGTPQS